MPVVDEKSGKEFKIENEGYNNYIFDIVKLVLYTLYFGKQQLNDFTNMCKNFYNMKVKGKRNTLTSGDFS